MNAHLAPKASASDQVGIALRAPNPVSNASTICTRMYELSAAVRAYRNCLKKPHRNFCFVTSSSFRRASHDPPRDVGSGCWVSVVGGAQSSRARWPPDFASCLRMLAQILASLVWTGSHSQSKVERLPFRVCVSITSTPFPQPVPLVVHGQAEDRVGIERSMRSSQSVVDVDRELRSECSCTDGFETAMDLVHPGVPQDFFLR